MLSKIVLASILALGTYDSSRDISIKEGYGHTYDISQKQAEHKLDKLAKTATLEDAWMYYNNTLIDVGFNEKTEGVDIFISDDYNIQTGRTIVIYHNHPSKDNIYPPSPTDILFKHVLNKYYHSNKVIARMFDGKRVWEYDVKRELSKELNKLYYDEQKVYLKSKIDSVYNHYTDSSYVFKDVETHIKLMNKIGIIITTNK